ncbi:unnamed protein product [Paramecium octaurelia]|uniref:Tetratricopeptide repeat protein n=1 Tax=Paramecium octaurelia TaxID=43137 RepID=A0A8S1X533_PAROT|nr:unnamed protein product [Paramecium octaurelia]
MNRLEEALQFMIQQLLKSRICRQLRLQSKYSVIGRSFVKLRFSHNSKSKIFSEKIFNLLIYLCENKNTKIQGLNQWLNQYYAIMRTLISQTNIIGKPQHYSCLSHIIIQKLNRFEKNSYNIQIKQFRQMMKIPIIILDKASVLCSLNRYQEALEQHDVSISKNPENLEYRNLKACTLFKMKRLQEALECFYSSIQENSDSTYLKIDESLKYSDLTIQICPEIQIVIIIRQQLQSKQKNQTKPQVILIQLFKNNLKIQYICKEKVLKIKQIFAAYVLFILSVLLLSLVLFDLAVQSDPEQPFIFVQSIWQQLQNIDRLVRFQSISRHRITIQGLKIAKLKVTSLTLKNTLIQIENKKVSLQQGNQKGSCFDYSLLFKIQKRNQIALIQNNYIHQYLNFKICAKCQFNKQNIVYFVNLKYMEYGLYAIQTC